MVDHSAPNHPLSIEDILAFSQQEAAAISRDFIRHFYKNSSSLEDYTPLSPKILYDMAHGCFEKIQLRKKEEKHVHISSPKGWGLEEDRHIIEINHPDIPFLVDSLSEMLNRLEHEILLFIHPVIGIYRDEEGKMIAIENAASSTKKEICYESIMHIHVNFISHPEALKKLEEEIQKILRLVGLAVSDWKMMLHHLDEEIKHITPSTPDAEEFIYFLHWIKQQNFVFLGVISYIFVNKEGKDCFIEKENSALGILKEKNENNGMEILSLPREISDHAKQPVLFDITKTNKKSLVHRSAHMDCISIKHFDASGKIVGEICFVGLFATLVYYQSAHLIPLIRKKTEYVIHHSGFFENSHNGKALRSILDSYPRDELFQASEEQLKETCLGILSLSARPRLRLFVRKDMFNRFINCMVFVPQERFNKALEHKIHKILEEAFQGHSVDKKIQVTETHLVRCFMIIKTDPNQAAWIASIPLYALEEKLREASVVWEDALKTKIEKSTEKKYVLHYKEAFPTAYQDHYTSEEAYKDILKIEEAYEKEHITLDLLGNRENASYYLKMFSPHKPLSLSDVMPLIEHMGFSVFNSYSYCIDPAHKEKPCWMYHFELEMRNHENISHVYNFKEAFEEAFLHVWLGTIEDDGLNELVLLAGLTWRDVTLLRAYRSYLVQIGLPYSISYMEDAFARHPLLACLLVQLFHCRFNPYENLENRADSLKEICHSIETQLNKIINNVEDTIIRRFYDVIMATLRTNYFQTNQEGTLKNTIALKFDTARIPELPLPCPYTEIFVYAKNFEAIHIRGGRVARGGLRWSDRPDFRPEVLGLMKAQMVKNSVIVPVGSKGGFFIKTTPSTDRAEFLKEGVVCYKEFLRNLLDITDNRAGDAIISPKDAICYDKDDPYLVVAADKGTASFSDYANEISREYGFWLQDAFASGGSVGYDHKAMGITAKGGWISITRHFNEMGKDIQKEEFTVVGIGDMAGDVFGNGMLLSDKIRLVGAFNHMHIFLDPNPDAHASYLERKRLFALPSSTWASYDASLISPGGGVFERKAKTIPLSPQMQDILGIKESSLSPHALIKALLCAKVDLLWNGGIGTFVKAERESHESIKDKNSDAIRVDAKKLRCKIVGEGGNLGFTALGRIEFALKGGRINNDAIDNSAGVDCSDHEVNIKIAFSQALEKQKVTMEHRDALLKKMTDAVAMLVLTDNTLQTQAITLAEWKGNSLLEGLGRFMVYLEQKNLLNRELEFLPNEEEMTRRMMEKKGLTRPEIAVLLSYSKIALNLQLLHSALPDEPFFEKDLMRYFPEDLRNNHSDLIIAHPLRREIISTCISNVIVNRMGITFLHQIESDTSMPWCDIARAFVITREIFNLDALWSSIEKLDGKVTLDTQMDLFLEVEGLVERVVLWFLRNIPHPLNVGRVIETFGEGVKMLFSSMEDIFSPTIREAYEKKKERYIAQNVDEDLAKTIAKLIAMSSACDIVHVAQKGKIDMMKAGSIYFNLGTRLHIGWVRSRIKRLVTYSYWEKMAIKTLTDSLFDNQMRLASDVIKNAKETQSDSDQMIQQWCERNAKTIAMFDAVVYDLKLYPMLDLAKLVVAVQRFGTLCPV